MITGILPFTFRLSTARLKRLSYSKQPL